jgi:dynein heavy chain, axonemal
VLKRNQLSETVQDLMERLKSAQGEADEINTQEKMFGWAQTKYHQLHHMCQRLDPFLTLWTTTAVFYDKHHDWMNGPFSRLEAETVETEAMDAYRKVRFSFYYLFHYVLFLS